MSRLRTIGVWVAILCSVSVAGAAAPTTLRWKFKVGDKLNYQIDQDTQQRQIIDKRESKNTVQQKMEQLWQVKKVAEDGSADFGVMIKRIIAKYDLPNGVIQVDTLNKKAPEPEAAPLDAMLRSMTGHEFTVRMTPRGLISNVVIPEALKQEMAKRAATDPAAAVLNDDSLKELLSHGSVPLPDKGVSIGATWTDVKKNPGFSLTLNYKYAGQDDAAGKTLDKFVVTGQMSIDQQPTPDVEVKLAEQSIDGTVHFDNRAGRLVDTEMTQRTALDIKGQGMVGRQEVQVKMSSQLVTPGSDTPAAAKP